MPEFLVEIWPHLTAAFTLTVSVVASAHAVLNKRDTRAAVGWVGLIWLVPVVGAILYVLLGINRIRRRATALRTLHLAFPMPEEAKADPEAARRELLGPDAEHLVSLIRLTDRVAEKPLLRGNAVTPLIDGDQAYPAMLDAIDGAERTISLTTYIFDNDAAGRPFRDALARADRRGVEVRVLVDSVGARYSWPSMVRSLQRAGIRVAKFLPTLLPLRMPYLNLRNHRKILVVDGRVGFTGGMNIREGHVVGRNPRHPVRDVHFRIDGPVVAELQGAFADDWAFTVGERLRSEAWFPQLEPTGPALARGITDGPDEDFERLAWTIHGALACARWRVRIMTPYFLPDPPLISALSTAAMRGVDVEIILPEAVNLALVRWASMAQLWQVLERGCRVYLSRPPFDHTKLMLVDGAWSLIGSANWDPRSLRLNFEFNVECYDAGLASILDRLFEARLAESREITLEEVKARGLPTRLRDGVARLFSPYL